MRTAEAPLLGRFFSRAIWWINGAGAMSGREGLWRLLFGVWMIGVAVGAGCVVRLIRRVFASV